MKKTVIAFSIAVFGLTVISCNETTPETNNEDLKTDSVEVAASPEKIAKYDSLVAELNTTWSSIDSIYNDVFDFSNRLLDEVSYTSGYNQDRLSEVREKIKGLKQYHYTADAIPDFDQVGIDDEEVEAIVSEVIAFAAATPEKSKYPLIDELISDISKANGTKVASKRASYSTAVREFNAYVAENKEVLTAAKKNTERLPSFFLEQ